MPECQWHDRPHPTGWIKARGLCRYHYEWVTRHDRRDEYPRTVSDEHRAFCECPKPDRQPLLYGGEWCARCQMPFLDDILAAGRRIYAQRMALSTGNNDMIDAIAYCSICGVARSEPSPGCLITHGGT